MNNYNTGQQTDLSDQASFFGDHGLQDSEVWGNANELENEIPMHTVLHSERGIAGFVSKLYQCLQSNDSNPKYVRWCKHNGKDMFVIDCIPEFTEAVLPRLFKHCKFPSFVRQLNIYGFQRDTDARKTKDTKNKVSCRWYHPYFRPNRRDLFHLIRRKATRYSRKKSVKQTTEEDPETILSADEDEDTTTFLKEEDDPDDLDYQEEEDNKDCLFQHVFEQEDHKEEQSNDNSNVSFPQADQAVTHPLVFQQQSKDNNLIFQQDSLSCITASQLQPTTSNTTTAATAAAANDPYLMKQEDPYLRIQQLELQLYQLKLKYDKMETYLTDELNRAKHQMEEYQHHIHQLEAALGISKAQTSGYISTAYPTNSYTYNNHIMYIPQQQQQSAVNFMYHKVKPQQNNNTTAGSSSSTSHFQTHNIDFNTFM